MGALLERNDRTILSLFKYFKLLCYIPKLFKYLSNPVTAAINYELKGIAIVRLKNGKYVKVQRSPNLYLSTLINLLDKKWKISSLNNNDIFFEYKGISLIQPNFGSLATEDIQIYYFSFDVKQKVVLDVGSYFGETPIMFLKWGKAKQIIAVEPVPLHLHYLKLNIEVNKCSNLVEILPFAVSSKNGIIELKSNIPIGIGAFGIENGDYKLKVKAISWRNLLKLAKKKKVNFAKIDCEGAEEHLVNVESDLLKNIPEYLIEIHNKEIEKKVLAKFESVGYKVRKLRQKGLVSLWYFSI